MLTFGPELVGDPGVAYIESRISGIYLNAAEILADRDTRSRVQLLALNPDGAHWLRDTKARHLPAHYFTAPAWTAFLQASKAGEFG